MVFTALEIVFVGFSVLLVLVLFLLLARAGFFVLPKAEAKRKSEGRQTVSREEKLSQKKQRETTPGRGATKRPAAKSSPQSETSVAPAKKGKEDNFATVINFVSDSESRSHFLKAKPKPAPKKLAQAVEKKAVAAEKASSTQNADEANLAAKAPAKKERALKEKPSKEKAPAQRESRARPKPAASAETETGDHTGEEGAGRKKERRVFCFSCGEIGHSSKDCKVEELGLLCFFCGDLGHLSRDCPAKNSPERLKCYYCAGTGHITRDCPVKPKRKQESTESTPNTTTEGSDGKEVKAKKPKNQHKEKDSSVEGGKKSEGKDSEKKPEEKKEKKEKAAAKPAAAPATTEAKKSQTKKSAEGKGAAAKGAKSSSKAAAETSQ